MALKKIDEHPVRYASDRLAALSGKGYAALWLGNDHQAYRAYAQAFPLAKVPSDRKVVSVGLARALIANGRPIEAFNITQPYRQHPPVALQSAIAANLLDWNVMAKQDLALAAPAGHYVGPDWEARLYRITNNYVDFALQPKIRLGFHYSSDIDSNINQIYSADAFWPGRWLSRKGLNPTFWQVGFQQTQVADPSGQVGLSAIRAGWSAIPSKDWRYSILAGLGTSGKGWTYASLHASTLYQPSDSWGLDGSADRELVRTLGAVQNQILVNTLSVGGFGRLRDLGTLSAAYFHQSFSDDNQRNGVVVRLTPEFLTLGRWPIALGIQGYYRQFESSVVPYAGYFNPQNYREALAYLIYVQKFSPYWTLRFYSGFGSQTIDGVTSGVQDYYGTLTGLISPYCSVSLTGGYSNIANVYGGGPGYHRSYFGGEISIPF
ncbi:hypothetical protein [Acidithiobacillus sp. AMEEHan]|uniref:hypothetical protein n=1 Tax=Acidithiobacillus sp. AMEEHan TaxID=2994951 RepID=UPI0027E4F00C|nr:hypothetical protein [Acidithiobacillus sp. AMEEHan]